MIYSFYFNWWIDKYFVQKKILINFSKISIKDRLINYKHDYTLFIERSKSRMWNPFLNFSSNSNKPIIRVPAFRPFALRRQGHDSQTDIKETGLNISMLQLDFTSSLLPSVYSWWSVVAMIIECEKHVCLVISSRDLIGEYLLRNRRSGCNRAVWLFSTWWSR